MYKLPLKELRKVAPESLGGGVMVVELVIWVPQLGWSCGFKFIVIMLSSLLLFFFFLFLNIIYTLSYHSE